MENTTTLEHRLERIELLLLESTKRFSTIVTRLELEELLLGHGKKALTFDEACDYTGLSRSYMYKLTHYNKIPYSKPQGKLLFFDRDKLDEWLLANPHRSKDELKKEALEHSS